MSFSSSNQKSKLLQALQKAGNSATPISDRATGKRRYVRQAKVLDDKGNEIQPQEKPKRINPFVKIAHSFKQAKPYVRVVNNTQEKSVSIIIENVMLASLNEILASKETFSGARLYQQYKEDCKQLMVKVLKTLPIEQYPTFTKPVKITYYRQSTRYMDNDSLSAAFKHYTDTLIKNDVIQLLVDDNPNFIPSLNVIQKKKTKKELEVEQESLYCIGIRIEEIQHAIKPINDIFEEWGFIEKQDAVLNTTSSISSEEDLDIELFVEE